MPLPAPMRRVRLLLWSALVVAAPWPFTLVEDGQQPVASLFELLGVTGLVIATEGADGAVGLVAGMLLAQAAAGAALFGAVAHGVALLLSRLAPARAATGVGVALALLVVLVALATPLYRTPFRGGGLHSTLAEVFE